MKYGDLRDFDVANGTGIRVTLFVSGCRIHCPNCFNPEAQSFEYGKDYTDEVEELILKKLKGRGIKGLSILGGEPFEPENQRGLIRLIMRVKQELKDRDIWMWTGYVYDKDLVRGGSKYVEGVTDEIFKNIDVLIDGPFMEEFKAPDLFFRGSANQRMFMFHNGVPALKMERPYGAAFPKLV